MIAEWHDKFDATLLEYAQTKVSGALADDLVADTWTQAWLSLDKFTGDPDSEEPLHWLKWMLGNLLKDKIKSETRRKKREKAPRKRQETHMQADAEFFREIVRTEARHA
jgi:Sigma-70 region 2.